METKSEELIAHPENLSIDRIVSTDIKETKNEVYKQMGMISKDMQQYQTTRTKLIAAKRKVTEMIREMQNNVEESKKGMTIKDKQILNNRNSFNTLLNNISD